MSFGIVGMLTARDSFRTRLFFQDTGLTQDKVAMAVTDYRRGKVESDTTLFQAKQTLKEMEKNVLLREKNEKKQASKEANKQANLQAHLAKQQKRTQALLTKPMKVEVTKINLTKLSEEELKKELGRLAVLKQAKELKALRLKDEETRRLEREQRAKIEAEQKAKKAEIDRKKTEEKKAKELASFFQIARRTITALPEFELKDLVHVLLDMCEDQSLGLQKKAKEYITCLEDRCKTLENQLAELKS
jgi:hypothetical protein